MRSNVINSFLGTSDFDEYRTAINMREILERAKQKASAAKADIESISQEGKLWIHRSNPNFEPLSSADQSKAIENLRRKLADAEEEIKSSQNVLASIGVSYDESWFDPAQTIAQYRDERWEKLNEIDTENG